MWHSGRVPSPLPKTLPAIPSQLCPAHLSVCVSLHLSSHTSWPADQDGRVSVSPGAISLDMPHTLKYQMTHFRDNLWFREDFTLGTSCLALWPLVQGGKRRQSLNCVTHTHTHTYKKAIIQAVSSFQYGLCLRPLFHSRTVSRMDTNFPNRVI